MPAPVALSGPEPRWDLPEGAIDCGDGYYITQDYEPCGEPRYCSCSPGGAVCRYSNDLWQAQIYVEHLRGNLPSVGMRVG